MKKIQTELKAFHWRLWLSLCALALIPAVYQTVKTFLLSLSGQAGVFDIIGQMEWFDLINETLQAFLIVPLYAVLNRVFKDRRAGFAEAVYKTGLCAVLLYALFSVGVLFWGWLLIPISALAEVIRSDCKYGYRALRQGNYYAIAAASVLFWAATVPVWVPFFRDVQGLDNAADIFGIVIRLVPFYIAYAGCAIIDSIFVGLGKTGYTAANSLLVNLGYYGVFYVLYRARAITFTMDTIILMFGFGMVVHCAISLIQERVFLRKRERNVAE